MSDTLWLDSSVPSVNGEGLTILWNSSNICKPNISILDYIELHALSLRKKYLSFVHDLGQYEINNKRIVSHLSEKRGYNLWWMSQIAEKHI